MRTQKHFQDPHMKCEVYVNTSMLLLQIFWFKTTLIINKLPSWCALSSKILIDCMAININIYGKIA